jgi:hypothetical protein
VMRTAMCAEFGTCLMDRLHHMTLRCYCYWHLFSKSTYTLCTLYILYSYIHFSGSLPNFFIYVEFIGTLHKVYIHLGS